MIIAYGFFTIGMVLLILVLLVIFSDIKTRKIENHGTNFWMSVLMILLSAQYIWG